MSPFLKSRFENHSESSKFRYNHVLPKITYFKLDFLFFRPAKIFAHKQNFLLGFSIGTFMNSKLASLYTGNI